MILIDFGPSRFEEISPGISIVDHKGLVKFEHRDQYDSLPSKYIDKIDEQTIQRLKLKDGREAVRVELTLGDFDTKYSLYLVWCHEKNEWLGFIRKLFTEDFMYPKDHILEGPFSINHVVSSVIKKAFKLDKSISDADVPVSGPELLRKAKQGKYNIVQKMLPISYKNLFSGGYKSMAIDVPIEIQESLFYFKKDYPKQEKTAFLIMRFGKTKAHALILKGIRKVLKKYGITVLRADDKQYHDDLFYNTLTYIYGSGFGIAVYERIEAEVFNPNVSIEVGYMLALKKPLCLMKDKNLKTLPADIIGKLYKEFDPQSPIPSIEQSLTQWLVDKEII